jgi:hypothetical protein
MTSMEILLLLAIATLVYQEISWRDKARRIQADYEKRISTEVAMAYETSLAGAARICVAGAGGGVGGEAVMKGRGAG